MTPPEFPTDLGSFYPLDAHLITPGRPRGDARQLLPVHGAAGGLWEEKLGHVHGAVNRDCCNLYVT